MMKIQKKTAENWKEELFQQLLSMEKEIFGASAYAKEDFLSLWEQEERYPLYYREEKGQILAYLFCCEVAGEAEILKIAVREEERGKGLAEALLHAIAAEDVFLEVREGNARARAFYTKQGFEEIGRRKHYYADTKEDAVLMKMEGK